MSITEFENSLLENYEKYRGPFNWLASERELGVYNYLSHVERRAAMMLVYTKYADTAANITDRTTPIEKIFRHPVKFQELFDLIVCTALIGLVKENGGGTRFCVGDCVLPDSRTDTHALKQQFEVFRDSYTSSDTPWVTGLKDAWGSAAILTWVDRQISFLSVRLKSASMDPQRNRAASKSQKPSQNSNVDPYSVVSCEIIDYTVLSADDAVANLEKLVGLSEIKRKLMGLIAAAAYNDARKVASAASQPPSFNNFIISGPPGVGKTTSARLVAGILASSELVKNKVAVQTTTSALIGVYIGTTEAKLTDLFNKGRGGIIIIDEADSLAPQESSPTKFHEGAIATLNALIGYEKDNDTGTIVILTGYESGIQNLLRMNAGLRRRFPNYIALPSYDSQTLKGICAQMLEARSYKYEVEILEAANKQLMAAKDHMGMNFGNAGTVEEFINVMEAGRAQRIGLTKLSQIVKARTADIETASKLSELSLIDIPMFDKEAKIFQSSYLSVV